jgi:hypothetical protein
MSLTFPLLLLLSAATAPPPPAAPDAAATDGERFPTDLEPRDAEVPPGGPADQALWKELRQEIGLGIGNVSRMSTASYRMQYGRYYQALDERAKAGDAEAEALRASLEAAGKRAEDATPRKAIIHPCRVTLLELEHRMPNLDDPRAAEGMPKVRSDAGACVRQLRTTSAAVVPAAEALEHELARADRHLNRARPVPPGGAKEAEVPGKAPDPAGAAAKEAASR